MNNVKEFFDENFDFMWDPEWLPPPETKRKKLSLSLNKRIRKTTVDSTVRTSSRFGSTTSEEELGTAAKGVILSNTLCNTRWAENTF